MALDATRPFLAVNIAVLTVSDTRTLETDTSGATLAERIVKAGHTVAVRMVEKDDAGAIEVLLRRWIADPSIDVVITTGGTYLFALPGSTGAVRDGWDDILVNQLDNRFRPCNLVELMPRLQEHLKPAAE